jgi:DNA-binding NarL/FixJ family response regulator
MKKNFQPGIFLVDDHPLVRQGLAQLLAASGFNIAGQAEDITACLAHPDLVGSSVVIVDLSLAGENGIDLVHRLAGRGLDIVVYSMHESPNVIRRALTAGALGYVTKRDPPQQLIDAIQAALAGSSYHSPRVQEALGNVAPEDFLSDQQRRIFDLLGDGCSNEEIALQLGISGRTLESYCVRIMDKLGVHGIKDLRQRAIRAARPGQAGQL